MKNNPIKTFILIVCLVLVTNACTDQNGTISVHDIWARPGLQDGNSAVFMSIQNQTSMEEKLIGVTSSIATSVEMHKTYSSNGVMKMEPQSFVSISRGETIVFAPGGLHVMLIGLKSNLKPGDEFQITCIFEQAGEIDLIVEVKEP